MGQIKIENLELFANHGVLNEENVLGQKFIINAIVDTDFDEAVKGDDISKALNYAEICDFIQNFNKLNTFKLIETAADTMALELIKAFRLINAVQIELKKPNPPIHMHFDYVSVCVKRSRHKAFIALGSNVGDKETYLNNALNAITENEYCTIKNVSTFIKTFPYGGVEQDDFLNGCIEIETLLSPYELLKLLQKIENKNERVRTVRWGPRTLDLDILLYDNEIICNENLIVPHPDMQNRDFVLAPLSEIAPYTIHPVLNKSISQLYKALKNE